MRRLIFSTAFRETQKSCVSALAALFAVSSPSTPARFLLRPDPPFCLLETVFLFTVIRGDIYLSHTHTRRRVYIPRGLFSRKALDSSRGGGGLHRYAHATAAWRCTGGAHLHFEIEIETRRWITTGSFDSARTLADRCAARSSTFRRRTEKRVFAKG